MLITKKFLRQVKCEVPGCQSCDHEVHLHAQCHKAAKLNIFFDKKVDVLVVTCGECGSFVVAIDVVDSELPIHHMRHQ